MPPQFLPGSLQSHCVTRRRVLQAMGAVFAHAAMNTAAGERMDPARSAPGPAAAMSGWNSAVEYGQRTLAEGIRSRRVDTNNGVTLHMLEAGFGEPGRPCVVLLHGFPELAYSWRNQLLPLAQAGFHVVAPDLRGYGRSADTPVRFDDELVPYSLLNRAGDVLGLVRALGYQQVAAVVGHDWGGPVAAWCALLRPDVFRSVVSMSTPLFGAPDLPLGTAGEPPAPTAARDIDRELAALPRPRKHYQAYSATRAANENMWHAPQGVHDLLRALFHFKSADWKGNKPFALQARTATELARMPAYYIMDLDKGIAETMAEEMPDKAQIAACRWLTEAELQVYSEEYLRTGFQGGLNAYRTLRDPAYAGELRNFAGRTIDVPSCFIAGASDWGPYQSPGALEEMKLHTCTRLRGVYFVEGAGHSLAEEQPEAVNRLLLGFLRGDG